MSLKIDPNAPDDGGGFNTPPWLTAGQHVVWAADIAYSDSQNGDRVLEVLFACVDGPQAGARMYERFYLTQRAAWKIRKMARALGCTTAFDAFIESETREVMCARPVRVNVTTWQTNKGDDRPQVDRGSFERFDGEVTEQMESYVVRLEDYAAELKKKQRGSRVSRPVGASDDIPF